MASPAGWNPPADCQGNPSPAQYALLSDAVTIKIAGRVSPTSEQRGDVVFGLPLLAELAKLQAATALVVREGDVIAVRCAESLDAMIERSGRLCRARGWTLIMCQPDDGRGLATLGPETIRGMRRAHAGCLALGNGVEPTGDLLWAADKAGIAVVRAAWDHSPRV